MRRFWSQAFSRLRALSKRAATTFVRRRSLRYQTRDQSRQASVPTRTTGPVLGCMAIVCLLALSGCASVQVKLGWKVYLAKTPVTSMDVKLPNGPGIAPGQNSPLVVSVTEPNGKVLLTEGKGGRKVMWQDLQVTASVVTVNKKGVVSLAKDPRVSDGKIGHVTITVPSHPDLHADLDIPFRYNIAFTCNFSGATGANGMNGSDGMDGASGWMGSMDPNNPSPGGDGGNGTDGSNGSDGGPGGDAPSVLVKVALQPGVHPLLQVSVLARGKKKFYLIDPDGGSLTVKADGDQGGSGGRGGRGGHGGSGGIGTPSGSNEMDGHDGMNGSDGPSGKGGLITVAYDAQVKPYLGVIHISSQNGPKPVFDESTVAALW
jgi:hypothetical protein